MAIVASTAACSRSGESRPVRSSDHRYALGRPVTATEIAAIDIDVAPNGAGLPPGRGSVSAGAVIFGSKCAVCHGKKGEGTPPAFPALVGRDPREGFPFATDYHLARTIGNYWPYATTVFDYVRRAMPLTAPGSLTNDEVYSVTAWLLAANELLPQDATLDSASLTNIRMPARDRFVPDDRRGGAEVR